MIEDDGHVSNKAGPQSGILISYVVSDETLDNLKHIDPSPAVQTHRFGLRLIELLRPIFKEFQSFNFVPVQDYPVATKWLFRSGYHYREKTLIASLPFINLLILKHVSRFIALARNIRPSRVGSVLIVHGLHLPHLLFALLVKLYGVRIGVVVTDEQGLILRSDGFMRRLFKRVDRMLAVALSKRFDFGIALSEGLAQTYLPNVSKFVLPGLYDAQLEARVSQVHVTGTRPSTFRVLYFGLLLPEYGIRSLIDAVPFLNSGIEIRIFGRGPLEAEIAEQAQLYSNLHWGGFVDQDRLVAEMATCHLLVNPRPADTELARMSSPSKLVEYAASGRSILTTRLPSILPSCLRNMIVIDDHSSAGIASQINAISRIDPKILREKGRRTQEFMREHYSPDSVRFEILRLCHP